MLNKNNEKNSHKFFGQNTLTQSLYFLYIIEKIQEV